MFHADAKKCVSRAANTRANISRSLPSWITDEKFPRGKRDVPKEEKQKTPPINKNYAKKTCSSQF